MGGEVGRGSTIEEGGITKTMRNTNGDNREHTHTYHTYAHTAAQTHHTLQRHTTHYTDTLITQNTQTQNTQTHTHTEALSISIYLSHIRYTYIVICMYKHKHNTHKHTILYTM